MLGLVMFCVFFFKQKTAYELRISDWSSDVCSSDLDREILRAGVSYTVETLAELRHDFPRAALVLIMGSDAFEHLHTWSRWQQLIELAHIAAIPRPGNAPYSSAATAGVLSSRRPADTHAIDRDRKRCGTGKGWTAD